MTTNNIIIEMLDKLVWLKTLPYCLSCASAAERTDTGGEVCLKCGSHELARYYDGLPPGNDTAAFYPAILNEIKAEECIFNYREDPDQWFENELNRKFGRVNICGTHFRSGTALRKLDFDLFRKKLGKELEELAAKNRIILILGNYYISHQLEMLIFSKTEELEKSLAENLYDYQPAGD